jgi:NAD(P)-dependent dehydrogenase (short-subunit alcohol dehydrogenase family)
MSNNERVALVTGSSAGIGRVTACALAREGFALVLANRSRERTQSVIDAITGAGGRAEFLELDLGDLGSVRRAARAFLDRGQPLDIIVNNAGMAGTRGSTKDGWELAFGTNYLGPYLLTRTLLPALEAAAGRSGAARIVNVTSTAHYGVKSIDWEALRRPTRSLSGFPEYRVSKLANILFTTELARRVGPTIHTYAVHPGTVASQIWRRVPFGLRHLIKAFMISTERGARTSIYCATSHEVRHHTGRYYDRCREKRPSRLADDARLARELWERSEAWTH